MLKIEFHYHHNGKPVMDSIVYSNQMLKQEHIDIMIDQIKSVIEHIQNGTNKAE